MPCSHNCDRGQSAVNDQNGVSAAGQQSLKLSLLTVKISLISRLLSSFLWVKCQRIKKRNQRYIVAVHVG